MPTQNRRDFVRLKARHDFDRAKAIPTHDTPAIREEMILAETHLETLEIQSKHLNQVKKMFGFVVVVD